MARKARANRKKDSIVFRFIDHLDRHEGSYNLFLAIIVAAVALVSFIIAIKPLDKKPDIQLYTDAPLDVVFLGSKFVSPDFSLYIFNAGTAPCFDIVLTTHSFIQGGEMVFPEKGIIPALVDDSAQKTTFYLDSIKPDETIKIKLKPIEMSSNQIDNLVAKLNPSTLEVKCVEDSKTKEIFFKKRDY